MISFQNAISTNCQRWQHLTMVMAAIEKVFSKKFFDARFRKP
jgi:hypothetical protein